ncbi:unannotated protein [freshwater metagenome]|uniref:Unannotated protein n=1 Tax=freshwater metagenome TaxID=449393 RepID=A0A6J7DI75_9ZZZZ
MLSTNEGVVEFSGLFLGQYENPAGSVCKSLEQGVPPVLVWQCTGERDIAISRLSGQISLM